jgi:hypothetical protein
MDTLPHFERHFSLEPADDTAWRQLLTLLPPDLDQSARRFGALQRKRQIATADLLLRLILAYACGASLDTLAARATDRHLVTHLTDQALDERFARLTPWLSYLIGQQLAGAQGSFPWGTPLRLRLLDATCLSRPGATGTDWRLHLGLDLRSGLIDHLSVTGANIGEHLADFPLTAGDVVIADRGLATRQGLASVHARGAYSLIRLNWQNVPLLQPDGQPFPLLEQLKTVKPGTTREWAVHTEPTAGVPAVPGRLVVYALPKKKADEARRRVRKTARKKGKTPSAETLKAAGYLLMFTTVPAALLSTADVLAVYGMRWQVEITFKRGKSALRLAEIRATSDAVCYAVILAKCLVLLLLDRLAWQNGLFSPSGDLATADEPVPRLPGVIADGDDDSAPTADADGLAELAAIYATTLVYRTPPAQTCLAA